jgi:hypothetical protein
MILKSKMVKILRGPFPILEKGTPQYFLDFSNKKKVEIEASVLQFRLFFYDFLKL